MFQKLVKEHSTMQKYWQELLEKGFLETQSGSMSLSRKYAEDEQVLVIKDASNGILYTIRHGRLEVKRGTNSKSPITYTFRVGDMGKLDPENLDEAFDQYEGFESAIRDLYRTIDRIIKEYQKSRCFSLRALDWLKDRYNAVFLGLAIVYGLVTTVLLLGNFF